MAAGLVVPISGPYVGLWNNLPLGTLNDDGFDISVTSQGQEVNETDREGMTLVEGIYRGQNWRMRIRGLEWTSGLVGAMLMFGDLGTGNNLKPFLTAIGQRWTVFCKPLVLGAILGNPPSVPATLTAINAGIAPNSQSNFLMTSKVRELPLEMVFIPYEAVIDSQTYAVPFTTT